MLRGAGRAFGLPLKSTVKASSVILIFAASIWPIWNYTKLVIRSDIEGFRPLPFYFTNAEIFRRNNWFRVKS